MNKLLTLLVVILLVIASTAILDAKWKFGISDLTFNHPYHRAWADKAPGIGAEFDCDVIFLNAEMDVNKQISDMEALIQQKVDVINIIPIDQAAVEPVIKKAQKKGIKVFTAASTMKGVNGMPLGGYDVFQKIAKVMAYAMDQKGTTLFLAEEISSVEGKGRMDGYLKGMKDFPNIKVLAFNNAEGDTTKGMNIIESWLNKYPDVKAIGFASNGFALPALQLLKNKNLGGKILINGYDGSEAALEAIDAGEMVVDANISNSYWAWSINQYAYELYKKYPVKPIENFNIPLILSKDMASSLKAKGLDVDKLGYVTTEDARNFDKIAPEVLGKATTDKKFKK